MVYKLYRGRGHVGTRHTFDFSTPQPNHTHLCQCLQLVVQDADNSTDGAVGISTHRDSVEFVDARHGRLRGQKGGEGLVY